MLFSDVLMIGFAIVSKKLERFWRLEYCSECPSKLSNYKTVRFRSVLNNNKNLHVLLIYLINTLLGFVGVKKIRINFRKFYQNNEYWRFIFQIEVIEMLWYHNDIKITTYKTLLSNRIFLKNLEMGGFEIWKNFMQKFSNFMANNFHSIWIFKITMCTLKLH